MRTKLIRYIRKILNCIHKNGYHKNYVKIMKRNFITKSSNKAVRLAWIRKWSVFGQKADPIYFDVFSHYIGDSVDIVPENICHDVIERILNPVHYDGFYADKNNFDLFFPKGVLPTTILRKMNGFYLDADYNLLEITNDKLNSILNNCGCKKIVIKPTLDSSSGRGVKVAEKLSDSFYIVGSEKEIVSYNWLQSNYGSDFIIQEALEQFDYISQFNPTSVNTLRLTVYRSVMNNECFVPSAIMRIGGKGSVVDNAHAGGGFVALKLDGSLGKKVFNQFGESSAIFNDIDFSKEYRIENFDKIVDFAKKVGKCVRNHRLLALDIMVDALGNPRLIEFNTGTTGAYSMWLFQYTWTPAFGNFTDEIIDYCKNHLNEAQLHYYI